MTSEVLCAGIAKPELTIAKPKKHFCVHTFANTLSAHQSHF